MFFSNHKNDEFLDFLLTHDEHWLTIIHHNPIVQPWPYALGETQRNRSLLKSSGWSSRASTRLQLGRPSLGQIFLKNPTHCRRGCRWAYEISWKYVKKKNMDNHEVVFSLVWKHLLLEWGCESEFPHAKTPVFTLCCAYHGAKHTTKRIYFNKNIWNIHRSKYV